MFFHEQIYMLTITDKITSSNYYWTDQLLGNEFSKFVWKDEKENLEN